MINFQLNYIYRHIITAGQVCLTILLNFCLNIFTHCNKIVKHIGTKLNKRLARGDEGVNELDELCKVHDIAYSEHKNSSERSQADKQLASGAFKRLFSKNASLGERAASLLVSTAMGAKTAISKLGMGFSKLNCRKKSKKSRKGGSITSFSALINDAKAGIKKSKSNSAKSVIKAALRSAKKIRRGKRIKVPRIIKVPSKNGGVLPILPVLAGLGAIGSLAGSATGVAKTIRDIKIAKEQLEENKRHNRAMELKVGHGLYLGRKKGTGLYLKPYRSGKGLYLKPVSKNYH